MHALNRLRQLHLVANEHQVQGASGHRDQIAERDLAGFIDEEIVVAASFRGK